MVELLMVFIVIGILGAVALPKYLDFRQDAKIAAAEQFVQTVAAGIRLQLKQIILKCNKSSDAKVPLESIEQNDITAGSQALCTTSQIANESERKIFNGRIGIGSLPVNPITGLKTIGIALPLSYGETYSTNGTCSASSDGPIYGWCYDPTTGTFFAANDSSGRGLASLNASESSSESSDESSSEESDEEQCVAQGGNLLTCDDQPYCDTNWCGECPQDSWSTKQGGCETSGGTYAGCGYCNCPYRSYWDGNTCDSSEEGACKAAGRTVVNGYCVGWTGYNHWEIRNGQGALYMGCGGDAICKCTYTGGQMNGDTCVYSETCPGWLPQNACTCGKNGGMWVYETNTCDYDNCSGDADCKACVSSGKTWSWASLTTPSGCN